MDNELKQWLTNIVENSFTVRLIDAIFNEGLLVELLVKMTYLGLKILSVILIYKFGRRIVDKIVAAYERTKYYKELDESVKSFFHSFATLTLRAILMIICLVNLGVQGSSLLAFLGTMGVGIGLALKDSVANLAGGIIVLIFKNYRVGDYIDMNGLSGHVRAINVLSTQIVTFDNKTITIPNGSIIANPLTNFSEKAYRRVDVSVSISYDDDIDTAREALRGMIESVDNVIEQPGMDSQVLVGEYADSSINLYVRAWCRTEEYWDVYYKLMERVKPTLDANNLTIPYPQMDIHYGKEGAISSLGRGYMEKTAV